MATLQPVIVAKCAKCGLPPEYCKYNLEVDHGNAAAAPGAAEVGAKLGDLTIGSTDGKEETSGEAVS